MNFRSVTRGGELSALSWLRKLRLMILVACLLAAGSGAGRVFWRRQVRGRDLARILPGWHAVYRGAVRINGRPGALQVLHNDETLSRSLTVLRSAWETAGAEVAFTPGATMALGVAREKDRVTRLLLLNLPETAGTVVFSLEQTEADFRRTSGPPPSGLTSLPAYPGSRPQLVVENDDTRAGLEISRVVAPPESVRDFFDQALTESGYRRLMPVAAAADFMIYHRGSRVYCLLLQSPAPGVTMITLLHKSHEMK
ncbi:MAG: hypothetical protein ABR497_07920 [Kiritimatiellia bacterium]